MMMIIIVIELSFNAKLSISRHEIYLWALGCGTRPSVSNLVPVVDVNRFFIH